ncbi:DUF7848 domain-containing protein [Streptomyces xanthophaeus]
MSTVLRYVEHRIASHPSGEITVSAQCLDGACGWTAGPVADAAQVDVDCMSHTGRTGHPTFARKYEDVALVARVEP